MPADGLGKARLRTAGVQNRRESEIFAAAEAFLEQPEAARNAAGACRAGVWIFCLGAQLTAH